MLLFLLLMPLGTWGEPAPFADERAAMAQVEKAATPANLARLAAVRQRHAANFLALFLTGDDPQALREALAYAESATGLQADDAGHWRLLGQVYANFAGVPSAQVAAERCLSRAVELAPEDVELRILLAQQLLTRGRYDAALGHWEYVAVHAPERLGPVLVGSLATTYLLDRQLARGVKTLSELRAAHPDTPVIDVGLAVVLRASGEKARAAEMLTALAARQDVDDELRRYAKRQLGKWRHFDEAGP